MCVWQHEPNIQDCFPHGGGLVCFNELVVLEAN